MKLPRFFQWTPLALATPLLALSCNSILGFEEGHPYPPDAARTPDASMPDMSVVDAGHERGAVEADSAHDGEGSMKGDADSGSPADTGLDACSPDILTDPRNCGACGH